jgi:phage-related protein
MMQAGAPVLRFVLLFCFGCCASVVAQTDSTLSSIGKDDTTNRAPIKLVQKGDPGDAARKLPANQKPVEKKPLPKVSKERLEELKAFVKKHHPEIRPLLNSLQKSRPEQYEATMRTLDREVRNIQALEKRWPERYEKSLELWTTRSKITLLSAQLAIKKSLQEQQAIEKQIYSLIQKQHALRIEIVAADVKATRKRLERYEAELAKLKSNQKAEIERQMDVIKTNSQRIRLNQQKAVDARKANEGKKKTAPANKKPAANKLPTDKKENPWAKDDPTNSGDTQPQR